MNDLFVYANQYQGEQIISLAIGSFSSKRRVRLSEDEAYKLGCKLLSYARGGSTDGRVMRLKDL